jgi:hypothetical protein
VKIRMEGCREGEEGRPGCGPTGVLCAWDLIARVHSVRAAWRRAYALRPGQPK